MPDNNDKLIESVVTYAAWAEVQAVVAKAKADLAEAIAVVAKARVAWVRAKATWAQARSAKTADAKAKADWIKAKATWAEAKAVVAEAKAVWGTARQTKTAVTKAYAAWGKADDAWVKADRDAKKAAVSKKNDNKGRAVKAKPKVDTGKVKALVINSEAIVERGLATANETAAPVESRLIHVQVVEEKPGCRIVNIVEITNGISEIRAVNVFDLKHVVPEVNEKRVKE